MHYRIFSRKHNLYTDSPFWPSNQRTWSEWSATPDGRIIEIVFNDSGLVGSQYHNQQNFSIEPWTSFFDSAGKKIYRGDILRMSSFFVFKSEVVWKDGAFWLKALDKEGVDSQFDGKFAKSWTIVGNIHGV